MKDNEKVKVWLNRAKSNLTVARIGKVNEYVFYEDLCFEAQQSVEKAFKALCVYYQIAFPKTHDISFLISLVEKNNIEIPENIKEAKKLTDYAVETRYLTDLESVTEDEYIKVIEIAEKTLEWVEQTLK